MDEERLIPLDKFFRDPSLGRKSNEEREEEYEDAVCVNDTEVYNDTIR